MYIVGNEITVTWVLGPTDSPLAESAYDISIIPSNLEGTYTDAAIINYVAPTATTAGSIQYAFTPQYPGRWRITLTTGTGASYTVLEENHFWIFASASVSVGSNKVLSAISNPYPNFVGPVSMDGTSGIWREMHAVCRHHSDPTKLVCVGLEVFTDIGVSIGVIDLTDGTITVIKEPFGSSVTQAAGIACDGVGRYVLSQNNSTANFYYRHYADSTNLSAWTQCTDSGWNSQFHGGGWMRYSDELGFWFMGDQISVYMSEDGATWYQQNMDTVVSTDIPMIQCWGMLDTWQYKIGQIYFPGSFERPVKMVPTTSSLPLPWQNVVAGQEIGGVEVGIIDPGNPSFDGGIATDGDNIVMATIAGEMIYSSSGAFESWQIAAASQAGQDNNEWIDTLSSMGKGTFSYINGQWWAAVGPGGTGNWYYYDGPGLPLGNGWTQSDTGPFGQLNCTQPGIMYQLNQQETGCRLFFAGYDPINDNAGGLEQRVFYDTSHLP